MFYTKTFTIKTEISPAHYPKFLDFLYKYYLYPNPKINVLEFMDNFLLFKFDDIYCKIVCGEEINIELYSEHFDEEKITEIEEDLFIVVRYFEDSLKKYTLCFSWVEGQEIIPEKPPTRKEESKGIFGNIILIYILFFGINIVLFLLLGFYAVIFIILLQFLILLFSGYLYRWIGDWIITPKNPYVHILKYQLSEDEYKEFEKKFGKEAIVDIKKEIYNKTLGAGKPLKPEIGEKILKKYGFRCTPLYETSKTINVYEIVKKAAEKFKIPIPKIVVSNTMVANAAATGPNTKHGLIIITTGLLAQLEHDEILSVIGHELGHLVGKDPLVLLVIVSTEFVLRLTVLLPIVMISPLLYIFIAMAMIFFIAKFFEAKADLLSAIYIGKPKSLAQALRKIGYQRLALEREPHNKIFDWLKWDPHPPLYFRIKRLESLKTLRK